MKGKTLTVISLAASLLLTACATPSGGSLGALQRPTQQDVRIIETAQGLLSDASKWTRNDEQQCNLDATAWTLFCALQKASYEVLGQFDLRRPALEEVRMVVEQKAGRQLDKRLIDYNNLPTTTFQDIQQALATSLQKIKAKVPASQDSVN